MEPTMDDSIKFILNDLKEDLFNMELLESDEEYFPNYLSNKLNCWLDRYKSSLQQTVDNTVPFEGNEKGVTLKRLTNLITKINQTISNYYSGRLHEAYNIFESAMNEGFAKIKKTCELTPKRNFYRGRISTNHNVFQKEELFHIPYELRRHVTTNRYSIPGFPALYLGDSTYVCWEELNRPRLRDVYFSRFESTKELNVIEILLADDFTTELYNEPIPANQLTIFLRYLMTFPLIIASTCKVKEEGVFKPEYIIPQLLLQYVARYDDIDGIKFPSTKVEYKLLDKLQSYNYVFPVKSSIHKGYCDALKNSFLLTEPTSLELEEVLYNPRHHGFVVAGNNNDLRSLKLINGVKSYYVKTSFGKIESILSGRELSKID